MSPRGNEVKPIGYFHHRSWGVQHRIHRKKSLQSAPFSEPGTASSIGCFPACSSLASESLASDLMRWFNPAAEYGGISGITGAGMDSSTGTSMTGPWMTESGVALGTASSVSNWTQSVAAIAIPSRVAHAAVFRFIARVYRGVANWQSKFPWYLMVPPETTAIPLVCCAVGESPCPGSARWCEVRG